MNNDDTDLLEILRIAQDTSMRGADISLHEALARTRYKERRITFGTDDLRRVLKEHRELCEEWIAYSEDKRTSGGWYILPSKKIGRVGDPESQIRFTSLEEAVAEYVIREMDFWSNLHKAG